LCKLPGDEHTDVVCDGLAWFVRELMEAEVAAQVGAGLNERALAPGRATLAREAATQGVR
jgi:hypothetical protein